MLYIFAGIGIILGFVNTVAERSLRRRRENRDCGRSALRAARRR